MDHINRKGIRFFIKSVCLLLLSVSVRDQEASYRCALTAHIAHLCVTDSEQSPVYLHFSISPFNYFKSFLVRIVLRLDEHLYPVVK